MIGRTHGVHAEPITLGFKLGGWHQETQRHIQRLKFARAEISVGKISGAVGTYSNIEPAAEEYVCEKLSLKPERFATQIIARDRHGCFLAVLGLIASSLEKFALQIRLMQQTEISEVLEPFAPGQKGSSAMPHKRNPILCERVCGLARLIRANIIPALENINLWYERDISHSSAERVIFPESTILLDYACNLLIEIVDNLQISAERLAENLNCTRGLIFSQRVLLALTAKGLSREKAYEITQELALRSRDRGQDFKKLLRADGRAKKYLTRQEIEKCFDQKYFLRHIDHIFKYL
jgi:adenylosuccinate lyase